MCCRRRRALKRRVQGAMADHLRALQRVRARFAALWRACGDAKKASAQPHYGSPEQHWARFVVHKSLQRHFHLLSQLLKEVKQIKRALD